MLLHGRCAVHKLLRRVILQHRQFCNLSLRFVIPCVSGKFQQSLSSISVISHEGPASAKKSDAQVVYFPEEIQT